MTRHVPERAPSRSSDDWSAVAREGWRSGAAEISMSRSELSSERRLARISNASFSRRRSPARAAGGPVWSGPGVAAPPTAPASSCEVRLPRRSNRRSICVRRSGRSVRGGRRGSLGARRPCTATGRSSGLARPAAAPDRWVSDTAGVAALVVDLVAPCSSRRVCYRLSRSGRDFGWACPRRRVAAIGISQFTYHDRSPHPPASTGRPRWGSPWGLRSPSGDRPWGLRPPGGDRRGDRMGIEGGEMASTYPL